MTDTIRAISANMNWAMKMMEVMKMKVTSFKSTILKLLFYLQFSSPTYSDD